MVGKKRTSLFPRRLSNASTTGGNTSQATTDAREINVQIGASSQIGSKHPDRCEDRVKVGTPFGEKLLEESVLTGYAAVLDGHGGDDCAEYVSERMLEIVGESFKSDEDWELGEEKLRDLFWNLDQEFCTQAEEKDDTSGACATLVLVKNEQALIANVGDCRAVQYSAKGKVIRQSKEHRAGLEDEFRRISEAGGTVKNGRVHSLEPSRTFGDIDVKKMVGDDIIISEPDVYRFIFTGKGDFLIVATDGLWDKISNEKAAKVCKKALGAKKDVNAASEALVALAKAAGSADDITVAVLAF